MSDALDFGPLQKRVKDHSDWLQANHPECFTEQKHIHEGTQERVYWHYGYMAALRDVLNYLTKAKP